MPKTPLTVIFDPGCFDSFEGTQEELEELKAEIIRLFETGEGLENAIPLSDEEWEEIEKTHQKRPDNLS